LSLLIRVDPSGEVTASVDATCNASNAGFILRATDSGGLFPETATDAANNQATRSFTVAARYNFSGFFPPVDNPPVVNVVNAGRAIPVKFSLGGNKGLNIFAPGYPVSQQIALR